MKVSDTYEHMSMSVERILLAFHEIPIAYILDWEVVKVADKESA